MLHSIMCYTQHSIYAVCLLSNCLHVRPVLCLPQENASGQNVVLLAVVTGLPSVARRLAQRLELSIAYIAMQIVSRAV